MLHTIAKGILIGFIISLPVGPIGFMCLQYARRGFNSAMLAGLGAALADTLFASIAVYGLALIRDCQHTFDSYFHLIGGLFLSIIGSFLLFSNPPPEQHKKTTGSLFKVGASTFLLTLSNPVTILAFVALIGNFGLESCSIDLSEAAIFLLGVFIGGMIIWLLLAVVTSILMQKLTAPLVHQFRRLGGALLAIAGILAMLKGCRF